MSVSVKYQFIINVLMSVSVKYQFIINVCISIISSFFLCLFNIHISQI
jgi:hypothetical protein